MLYIILSQVYHNLTYLFSQNILIIGTELKFGSRLSSAFAPSDEKGDDVRD